MRADSLDRVEHAVARRVRGIRRLWQFSSQLEQWQCNAYQWAVSLCACLVDVKWQVVDCQLTLVSLLCLGTSRSICRCWVSAGKIEAMPDGRLTVGWHELEPPVLVRTLAVGAAAATCT